MIGFWKSVSAFLRTNALALASLCIAAMGLYLTITSQREEREHKELLIKPYLNLLVEVRDYSVTVVNRGLGPALITDVAYYLDGRCGTITRNNVNDADIVGLVRGLGHFFDQQISELMWGEYKSMQGMEIRIPMPYQIIAVNQEFPLFKLQPDIVEEVTAKLVQAAGVKRAAFNDEFARHSMEVPVRVRYCSMSEKYCHATVLKNVPCQFSQ